MVPRVPRIQLRSHMFGRAKNGRAMLGEPVPPGQYSRSRGRFRGCICDIASGLAWVGSETTYAVESAPQVRQDGRRRCRARGVTAVAASPLVRARISRFHTAGWHIPRRGPLRRGRRRSSVRSRRHRRSSRPPRVRAYASPRTSGKSIALIAGCLTSVGLRPPCVTHPETLSHSD